MGRSCVVRVCARLCGAVNRLLGAVGGAPAIKRMTDAFYQKFFQDPVLDK